MEMQSASSDAYIESEDSVADSWRLERTKRDSFEQGLLWRLESSTNSLYSRYKELEHEVEHVQLAKSILQSEAKSIKLKEDEVKQKLHSLSDETPLRIATFISFIPDTDESIVECDDMEVILFTMPTVNKELLMPGSQVLLYGVLEQSSFVPTCVIDVVPDDEGTGVSVLDPENRPGVKYSDIGGLEHQKMELRELIELPFNHADLIQQLGVEPPRGILLHGPPGCGKTMLVRAVATATSATFIYAVGSQFVKMLSGDGPRKVREIFRLAKQRAPSILFVDEIDSVAVKRTENVTGSGEKEIQRILMEFLVQMDGFERLSNVVIIMATNRPEILDPALLRPGRLDRKIEFPYPNQRERRLIFQTVLQNVATADDLDYEQIVRSNKKLSGADIQAIVREAAMLAARDQEFLVTNNYLYAACAKVTENISECLPEYYN